MNQEDQLQYKETAHHLQFREICSGATIQKKSSQKHICIVTEPCFFPLTQHIV